LKKTNYEYDMPDGKGHFDKYGGKYVPETLIPALKILEKEYNKSKEDSSFSLELNSLLKNFGGRETPLYFASNISKELGFRLYLKREDLLHTGAHKLNSALGQILLAKRMGKKRIIAETGAGQHGVATATVCAQLDLKCVIYMGETDIKRQKFNVYRMKLLGAEIISAKSGSRTLKDATNEAIRDWVSNVDSTYYLIGSAVGPHPYPMIVRDFQSVIGIEAKKQFKNQTQYDYPDRLVACVGGGSNAIGLFFPFIEDPVKIIGIEAAGEGLDTVKHAATLTKGSYGVLHGSASYLIQNKEGQILLPHSISAGLDYPGVGPEHSYLKDIKRVQYKSATDKEALRAFKWLSDREGIIPALETSHAIAYLQQSNSGIKKGENIILCLSGRGDKDLDIIFKSESIK
tara:strand:- start:916 stop:2121 length:1206 start_codon:yes stop_codon:yes gene_type:complete